MRRFLALVAIGLGLAMSSAPLRAQEPAAEAGPVDKPVWLTRPPFAQFPRGPSGPIRLGVALRCRVAGEALANCAAAEAAPEAYVQSALDAARVARIAALDGDGRATEGREIVVRIGFPLPVAVDPPAAAPTPAIIATPTWLERPTAADFARYHPAEARTRGLEGRATLECLVAANGYLACVVVSEEPPGRHFGEAALRVSRHFRMATETRDGRPTEGGRVRIPIRFSMQ